MRYWLETKKSHGTRLVSQTDNPKRPGLVWNKPHAGTYTQGAVVLHTDQNARVKERAFTVSTFQLLPSNELTSKTDKGRSTFPFSRPSIVAASSDFEGSAAVRS
jgi:hypothetical protein